MALYIITQSSFYAILCASFVGTNTCSLLLWYAVHRRRTDIGQFFFQSFRISFLLPKIQNIPQRTINLCLIFSTLIPIISAILSTAFLHDAVDEHKEFYNFFIDFKDHEVSGYIFRAILGTLCFISVFGFPAFIAVVCGTIYYHYSELLSGFCGKITDYGKKNICHELSLKLMKCHEFLCRMSLEIEDTLSLIVLILLCCQTLSMYIALSSLVLFNFNNAPASIKWQCIPAVTLIPASLIGVNLCASRISSQIECIQASLQTVRNNLFAKSETHGKIVSFLGMMMETKFAPMTAGGVLELKKGLILTVFGSLFTYGLLIINIKNE
ncbi:hypothetical protein AVEN_31848-1 [Araneus ventricosus]|uniref:Gustatory receptor n=1 Tax=Araneus ventricosus TaxID=182803 RepID=A0A4Y2L634_ARAVE|nr:hypothetical protein AVEN_31848-1 [Araneus ventricosus]